MTLWSGRFTSSMDSTLWDLSESYSFDHVLYHHDIMGTRAHVRGLEAADLITSDESLALLGALEEIESEFDRGVFVRSGSDEDIHTAIERRATRLRPRCGSLLATHSVKSRVLFWR